MIKTTHKLRPHHFGFTPPLVYVTLKQPIITVASLEANPLPSVQISYTDGAITLKSSHVTKKLLITCKRGLMYCDML